MSINRALVKFQYIYKFNLMNLSLKKKKEKVIHVLHYNISKIYHIINEKMRYRTV